MRAYLILLCVMMSGIAAAQPSPVVLNIAEVGVSTPVGVLNKAQVYVTLDEQSRKDFFEFSRRNVGKVIEILADDVVLVSPKILDPILGGHLQLLTDANNDTATELARRVATRNVRISVRPKNL